MIADAGLQNGSIRSDDSDLPAGTVTFQSIDGGQMVKKDTVINLRVSKGPEEAATPVVTNLTQDQAVLQDGVGHALHLRLCLRRRDAPLRLVHEHRRRL